MRQDVLHAEYHRTTGNEQVCITVGYGRKKSTTQMAIVLYKSGTASFPRIVPRNCLESKEIYIINSNLQFTLQISVSSN
jgi:hypothetical protein